MKRIEDWGLGIGLNPQSSFIFLFIYSEKNLNFYLKFNIIILFKKCWKESNQINVFYKNTFSCTDEKQKLKLVRYNKSLQKIKISVLIIIDISTEDI